MVRNTLNGFAAGLLISIGGAVFLSCDIKYIGAVLFSVALLCICIKGYALFTGKVGFLPESHTKDDVSSVLTALLGNTLATAVFGFLAAFAVPAMKETALGMCEGKLTQTPLQTLARAFFCGVLMYLAVSIYREKKTVSGILFCVPVFILSGFEHSIADMFYFACSGMVSLRAFGFIWLVIAGNAVGGVFLPLITGKLKTKATVC